MAGSRALKKRVRELLAAQGPERSAAELAGLPFAAVAGALIVELKQSEPARRHGAALALGLVATARAGAGPEGLEQGRELLRRLAWSLNEESGGIGWGAPEAMAEIMAAVPALAEEFGGMLASYADPSCHLHLEHPPLLAGALWALGRLAGERPGLMGRHCAGPALAAHLPHPDPQVRGAAAWALGRLGDPAFAASLENLTNDPAQASYYESGRVVTRPVADIARRAQSFLAED